MEYNVNDTVLYGTDGVCKIEEIARRKFRDSITEYYILKPLFNSNSTIYVPVKSEELVARMRHALTEKEVKKIMRNMPTAEDIWIDNESERKLRFKEIINSGDTKELAKLVKTLNDYKMEQKSIGKKLHQADEKLFKDAEKLLYEEFAVALGSDPEKVAAQIEKKLSK